MKKTILFASVIALSTAFVSCKKEKNTTIEGEPTVKTYEQLDKAKWLVGEWGSTSKEGNLTETWSQLNDSTLSGKTLFVSGKDTVFTETIEIVQKSDSLYYNTQVSNQNNGKPVSFKNINISDELLIFENRKHDFPQRIAYNRISGDSLIASISGMKEGKESKESYPMKKK